MPDQNHQFVLTRRPEGRPRRDDVALRRTALPQPAPGQALVRTLYVSLDPTNRIWMSDREAYLPPVALGEVMRAGGLGQVVQSRCNELAEGDLVTGMCGWQEYVLTGKQAAPLQKITPLPGVPLPVYLDTLGMTGLTAYFGLLDIGRPQANETLVVSAAGGAVGSVVGQIGKIKGCRVVGIAGTEAKCRWVTETLGFDACVNYKDADWTAKLEAACPRGIDINFENVGGDNMAQVLARMNLHGRVPLCGLISDYNRAPTPTDFSVILMRRLHVQGFIILDYLPRAAPALQQLADWYLAGHLKAKQTVVNGFEKLPEALGMLFDGANEGKLLVQVAQADT